MSPFSLMCYLTHRNAVKLAKKVFGEKHVEAVLQRLDRLMQDAAWIGHSSVSQGFLQSRPVYERGHKR